MSLIRAAWSSMQGDVGRRKKVRSHFPNSGSSLSLQFFRLGPVHCTVSGVFVNNYRCTWGSFFNSDRAGVSEEAGTVVQISTSIFLGKTPCTFQDCTYLTVAVCASWNYLYMDNIHILIHQFHILWLFLAWAESDKGVWLCRVVANHPGAFCIYFKALKCPETLQGHDWRRWTVFDALVSQPLPPVIGAEAPGRWSFLAVSTSHWSQGLRNPPCSSGLCSFDTFSVDRRGRQIEVRTDNLHRWPPSLLVLHRRMNCDRLQTCIRLLIGC